MQFGAIAFVLLLFCTARSFCFVLFAFANVMSFAARFWQLKWEWG